MPSAAPIPPSTPPASPPPPRSLRTLPPAPLFHSTNFLEEGLFSQAFPALTSSLTSGFSTNQPAYVPTPAVLSLAATISVHPNYTTKTADRERWRDADSALRYLREVVDVVGEETEEGGLREGFAFQETNRRGVMKKRGSAAADIGSEEAERGLAGKYANQQSLWRNAEDFWAVVGWAFNCSVLHKGRWERWRGLLDLLCDVLERDLDAAVRKNDVKSCLLQSYLQSIGGGRNDKRRIMRAILADGSEKSLAEFGEIWRDETRPPKIEKDDDQSSKKRKLDLENGEYGDYFDDDSAGDEEHTSGGSSTRRSRSGAKKRPSAGSSSSSPTSASGTTSISSFGGYDSLRLRQRFLALLAKFSHAAPKLFGADLSDLWSLYTEFLRPLPLPIFQQFISPQKAYLAPAWQASLCEMMSRALLGVSGTYGIVTLESFERDVVGATANNTTVVDNAKVGILVESLLRLLWLQEFLRDADQRLKGLVEEGIERREAKAAWRKKGGAADEEAREVLRLSGERLKVLVKVICA